MFADWSHRLRSLFRSRAVDRELDDELAFHLEQHITAGVARGLSHAEAERQARLALGGISQIREEHRDARGIVLAADAARDMRYAWRTFRRLPGFTTAALIVVALGIAATTVMFTVVGGVLLTPLPYPDAKQLVAVHGLSAAVGETWGFSYPDFLDLRRDIRSTTIAAWAYKGGVVSTPGEAAYVDGRQVSAELFSVLGARFTIGRTFQADDDVPGGAPVAVISDRLWKQRYAANTSTPGQLLAFDGTTYTVVGVLPAHVNLGGDADVFTLLGQSVEPRLRNRSARFLHVSGRLNTGSTIDTGTVEFRTIAQQLAARFPQSNAGREAIVRSLHSEAFGNVGSTLWLLLAAVALVLVMACVNVASLLLARAVAREVELVIRAALGASRHRLVRQCLTESVMMGVLGGLLGVPLAMATVKPFVAFWPGDLPRSGDIQLDWRVATVALAVSLICGIGFGVVPALRAPATALTEVLRGGSRGIVRGSRRFHAAFVVTQLALAIVLLVAAGTIGRALIRASALDPGFRVDRVVTGRLALSPGALDSPAQIAAAWNDVLARVRQVGGVESVALTDIVPMRNGENSLAYSATRTMLPDGEAPVALASGVTPEYLRVLGLSLRAGRFIDEHDTLESAPVIVVDEQLAIHAFGRTDVVDRTLTVPALGPTPVRIVGVVGHVRHWGLARDDASRVRDQMYYPLTQVPPRLLRTFAGLMSIAIGTQTPASAIVDPVRAALRQAGGHTIYEVRTMEQLVAASLARQRFLVWLFSIFGGVALLLACVGVYGVLAYLTVERTPEFCVRLALGSTSGDVIRLVLRESTAIIGTGIASGGAIAWIGRRLLDRVVEGAQPADLRTFVLMIALLATAAVAASLIPALRAGRVDPAHVLKN